MAGNRRGYKSRKLPGTDMIPPIANRFIAGETQASALGRARELNDRGVGAILNLLGEHYDDRELVEADTDSYLHLLEAISSADLEACISVKPSQVGLDISESVFREHLDRLVERAETCGGFVWLDMEDHTTTDATIDAFASLAPVHPGVLGLCLQANLRRTREDLQHLAGLSGKLRLVKGAYDEPTDIAFRDHDRVDEVFAEHLTFLFREHDEGVAVATHDDRLIERAIDLHTESGTAFELQMLMGVRESYQYELACRHPVWQYVPFGKRWMSYFSRRVTERKENLLFALRAVLGR